MDKTALPEGTLKETPRLHESVFVAEGARIIGDVRIARDASVWFNSVVRADINFISIGERTNIQDGCIIHLENEKPCIVGDDVTVGHGAILHGCVVEDRCLIGMGAVVLSGARIGKGSVIAAGTVIREDAQVPPFSLMAGVPGKLIRELPPETFEAHLKWAAKYVRLARLYREKAALSGERKG